MRSFSTTTATFVQTLPWPSISFPNRTYCVAAIAWDTSAIDATVARSVFLMNLGIVAGPGVSPSLALRSRAPRGNAGDDRGRTPELAPSRALSVRWR